MPVAVVLWLDDRSARRISAVEQTSICNLAYLDNRLDMKVALASWTDPKLVKVPLKARPATTFEGEGAEAGTDAVADWGGGGNCGGGGD